MQNRASIKTNEVYAFESQAGGPARFDCDGDRIPHETGRSKGASDGRTIVLHQGEFKKVRLEESWGSPALC